MDILSDWTTLAFIAGIFLAAATSACTSEQSNVRFKSELPVQGNLVIDAPAF